MKWRYSILLPLLHMVLSGILIFSEESRTWNFAMFHWSDEEILHLTKPKPGEIAFDPGYEFRPRTGVKVIMGAECPAYLLVGWYGRPPSRNGWLQPTLVRRLQHISPKARVVTLDVVLVLTIGLQWWLVGRWIDDRALGRQGSRRLIPVGIITLSAVIAAGLSPWETNPAVLIADVPVIAAFCGWIVMFVIVCSRRSDVSYQQNSRSRIKSKTSTEVRYFTIHCFTRLTTDAGASTSNSTDPSS